MAFMTAGGWSMWLILLFALATLVAAAAFVWKGRPRSLAVVRALTWATALQVAGALAGNFTAVMYYASRAREKTSPELPFDIVQGLGEASTPATLGFTLLSVAWLLVAVGVRRHDPA